MNMARYTNIYSLSAAVEALETQQGELLTNSVQPKDGTATATYTDDTLIPIQNPGEDVRFIKRSDFLTAVLGSIRRIDDDLEINEVTAVNQLVFGQKAGFFGDAYFFGRVLSYPVLNEGDIDDIFIFSTF
ncbi:MAG TPA: hypothetical protein VFM69_07595 [Pricia sp.]|nr:hypothetical protein [Pricia sp.]